jgi:hypothetical protein
MVIIQSGTSSSSSSSLVLPLVTPPIEESAPSGLLVDTPSQKRRHQVLDERLKRTYTSRRLLSFTSTDVRDRFFRELGGPTNLWDLLAEVDSRIQGVNQRIEQFTCFETAPRVPYNLTLWLGRNVTLYAQCIDRFTNPNGTANSELFGLYSLTNQSMELYMSMGETMLAAQVTLDATNLTTANVTHVRLWYSVGLSNVNGSHAVVEILADVRARVFEMSAAGVGIGFCGARLHSQGSTLTAYGSAEAGACQCASVATVCSQSSDVSVAVNCSETLPTFQLDALGRSTVEASLCTFNHSLYPVDGPYVQLSTVHRDDAYFGPRVSPI